MGPPADEGIIIQYYTLSCSPESGGGGFEAKLNPIETVNLDEFLPSTTYTCTISASTNGGAGPTASVTARTDGEVEPNVL